VNTVFRAGWCATPACAKIDAVRLRERLGEALVTIMQQAKWTRDPLMQRIVAARASMLHDRSLRVTVVARRLPAACSAVSGRSRSQVREYDYYVGVYDAVVTVSDAMCQLQFPAGSEQRACAAVSSEQPRVLCQLRRGA